jgi:DNA polymerase-1
MKMSNLNSHVLLVDGLNTFFRSWSNNPTVNPNGQHIGGMTGFLKSVGAIVRILKCTRVVLVFDGKNGSKSRRKTVSSYKTNRTVKTNLNRPELYDNVENETENMKYQISRTIEYIEQLPVDVIVVENFEADDVIAYLSQQYFTPMEECDRVTIYSTDKDFLQLANNKVDVYDIKNKTVYTQQKISEKFDGILVDNITILRAVEGDSSDNIHGIRGVGGKTLIKMFPELTTEKITFDMFKSLVVNYDGNSKKINDLKSNLNILDKNYEVMDLKRNTLSGTAERSVLDIIQRKKARMINSKKLVQLLTEDHAEDTFRDLHDWLYKTWSSLMRLN